VEIKVLLENFVVTKEEILALSCSRVDLSNSLLMDIHVILYISQILEDLAMPSEFGK
jgi:hypothetical protein